MAVTGKKKSKETEINKTEKETKTTKTTTTTVNKSNASTRPVVGIAAMVRRYGTEGVMDANASEYISSIRKILEDPAHSISISTKKLSDNAFAFSSGKYSIVVMVDTSISVSYGDLIREVAMQECARNFREVFGKDQQLLNILVVDKYSYQKYPQMAAHITRTLTAQIDKSVKDFTISDFTNQFCLNIDTDPVSVRNFIDKHSPKAVSCQSFGFVAHLGQQSMNRMGSQSYENNQPFFGVSGYVEFLKENSMPGTPVKFTPVVHITDIISVIPTSEIMAIAIPIAAEVFIGNGLWKQPFVNLNDKNGINIGNLINDPNTKKPWKAKNELELVDFFSKYIGSPLLCLDIVGGHARIPGLGKFAVDSQHQNLIKDFAKFLEVDPSIFQGQISRNIFSEIIGIAEVSKDLSASGLMDSREMTYLFAVANIGQNTAIEKLKYRFPDPASRMENIREAIGISVTPMNYGFCTMLNGSFVQACSSIIGNRMNISLPVSSMVPSISLAGLGSQTYSSGGMFSPAQGFTAGNFGENIMY